MSQLTTMVYADSCEIYGLGLQTLLKEFTEIQVMDIALNLAAVKRAVAEYKPRVLVFELDMPGMEGVEIVKWLEADHPDTRSLTLTMHQSKAIMNEIIEAGVHGLIKKGCSARELVSYIKTIGGGGVCFCAECNDIIVRRNKPMEHEPLTCNELLVLQLLCQGKESVEIAGIMHKDVSTVNGYRSSIAKKLGTKDPHLQAIYAVEYGLVNAKVCLKGLGRR